MPAKAAETSPSLRPKPKIDSHRGGFDPIRKRRRHDLIWGFSPTTLRWSSPSLSRCFPALIPGPPAVAILARPFHSAPDRLAHKHAPVGNGVFRLVPEPGNGSKARSRLKRIKRGVCLIWGHPFPNQSGSNEVCFILGSPFPKQSRNPTAWGGGCSLSFGCPPFRGPKPCFDTPNCDLFFAGNRPQKCLVDTNPKKNLKRRPSVQEGHILPIISPLNHTPPKNTYNCSKRCQTVCVNIGGLQKLWFRFSFT